MTSDQLPAYLRERYAAEISWLTAHGFNDVVQLGDGTWYAHNSAHDLSVDFPTYGAPEWIASDCTYGVAGAADGATPADALATLARFKHVASARALAVAAEIDALLSL